MSNGFDVGGWDSVFVEMRDDCSDCSVDAGDGWAGLERLAVVEALGGAHHFDGQDEFEIADDLA